MIEEQNAPEEQNVPQMSEAALSAMSALEGLGGAEELKEGLSGLETPKEEVAAPQEEAPKDPNDIKQVASDTLNGVTEEPKGDEPKPEEEEVTAEEPEGKEPKPEEKEELTIDSPIFGGKKEVVKKKAEEKKDLTVDLKDTEEMNKVIKDQTGYDDLNTLIESSLKFKEKESQVEEVMQKNAQFESIFENIPSELYQSIDLYLKGEDWKTPIVSKPNLDFSKASTDLDAKSLVENYLPGQFSKEEWEDYNSEDSDPGIKKAINLAINSSKAQFEADKIELDSFRSNQVEQATKRTKMINSSIDKSIEHLKNNIDGVDDGYIAQAKANLNTQKINQMLFNEDGTFKEDAALKLSFAEHGYDMMQQYKKIIQHQSETNERTEILERTPSTPKKNNKSGSTKQEIRPEVKQTINDLTKDLGQGKVY